MLTGRNIPSTEALQLGIVNYVVSDEEVDAKALEIAKTIASYSPDSVATILQGEQTRNVRLDVAKILMRKLVSSYSLDQRNGFIKPCACAQSRYR